MTSEEADGFLARLAADPSDQIDLAGAALALAALDRPSVTLDRYRRHLASLARDVANQAGTKAEATARVEALATILVGRYGYRGDDATYDDLANADLTQVIDRRRGLPVALGILYLHTARAQGWPAAGLAFPGHFLIRVDGGDGYRIVDPFNEGSTPTAADLRHLLRATGGETADLHPEHYAPVGDRTILVRLLNNRKLRLVRAGAIAEASRTLDRMLLFAPDRAALWQEAALMHLHLGATDGALIAIEHFMALPAPAAERHRMAALRQRLRGTLH